MLMSKGCSVHVRPLGIIHIAVSHSFNFYFTLVVLWVDTLSRTCNVFNFKQKNISCILLESIST